MGRLLFALAGLLSAGCAQVHVYGDEDLRRPEGVKYFQGRPVVLATRTDSCMRPTVVQVFHIPDTRRPQYVRQVAGLGVGGFTLANDEKGVVNKLEMKPTDVKVIEWIDAAGKAAIAYIAGKEIVRDIKDLEDK
jgi:hypothetical protein